MDTQTQPELSSLEDVAVAIMRRFFDRYRGYLWDALSEAPELESQIAAFLLNPEKMILYFGKTHLGIEYIGPVQKDNIDELVSVDLQYFDFSDVTGDELLDKIIGFSFDGPQKARLPVVGFMEDLIVPSNKAFDMMHENGWNFEAQSMVMGLNTAGFYLTTNEFTRLTNSFFYGTDEHGLLVRYIQWIDFFPINNVRIDEFRKSIGVKPWPSIRQQAREDALFQFPQPDDFQYEKLMKLNRFVEIFSSSHVTETQITQFLAAEENQFILKMTFFSKEIRPERECDWADGNRKPIKPDFFVVQPNGYADIVEFKLPVLKTKSVVGRDNRQAFSAEIQQYIAQTRVYKDYFDDPRNKKYVEEKHDLKVNHPHRWLVIGRRWMFSSEEWRSIEAEYPNFAIRTYDDIVDGVKAQLYS